jgi:hypothetical protein
MFDRNGSGAQVESRPMSVLIPVTVPVKPTVAARAAGAPSAKVQPSSSEKMPALLAGREVIPRARLLIAPLTE